MTEYKTITSLVADVDQIATVVEYWFGEAFKKPEPAIYVKGEEQPRITLANLSTHWQENGNAIESLDAIKSPVYNRDDVVVLTVFDLHRGLALAPTLPMIGRALAEQTVRDLLVRQCRYEKNKTQHFDRLLTKWLLPQHIGDEELREKIEQLFMPLYELVADFVQGPTWDIHFLKRLGKDIVVEKAGDFRIYEYHRMTGTPYQA